MKAALVAALLASTSCQAATVTINGVTFSGDLARSDGLTPGWVWDGGPFVEPDPRFAPGVLIGFIGPGGWFELAHAPVIDFPGDMMGYIYVDTGPECAVFHCGPLIRATAEGGPGIPFNPFAGPATMHVPVTITDADGFSSTFDAALSVTGALLTIAGLLGSPLADIGVGLDAYSFVRDWYGPATRAVYSGVDSFVAGVIGAGITSMGAGSVPIGPGDPPFDFAFGSFTGTFDANSDLTAIHNITLFVDGVPANPAGVPEASIWLMLVAGFGGLAMMRLRSYTITKAYTARAAPHLL